MPNIVSVEWMMVGISQMARAAAERGALLHLLAKNPARYAHDIAHGGAGPALVVHEVDTDDPQAVDHALEAVGRIDGLVTVDLYDMRVLDHLASLGLPGQDPESVRLVRDKARLRDHLHRAGLSTTTGIPLTASSGWRAVAERLGAPFLVKPNSGAGSAHVRLIRDAEDFAAFRREAPPAEEFVAETYLVGPLFSVETFTWDGQTRILGIGSRILSPEPAFREEVYAFPAALPEQDRAEIDTWIGQVLASVGYTRGFAHTEFIATGHGPELVEINPRLPGVSIGRAISETLGIDVYAATVDMALDHRPAIMDAELRPRGGASVVFLYPPSPGVLRDVTGLDALARHPGSPSYHPQLAPGDVIRSIDDQYGMAGFLTTYGATAELALLNGISAAGRLQVLVEPPLTFGSDVAER